MARESDYGYSDDISVQNGNGLPERLGFLAIASEIHRAVYSANGLRIWDNGGSRRLNVSAMTRFLQEDRMKLPQYTGVRYTVVSIGNAPSIKVSVSYDLFGNNIRREWVPSKLELPEGVSAFVETMEDKKRYHTSFVKKKRDGRLAREVYDEYKKMDWNVHKSAHLRRWRVQKLSL